MILSHRIKLDATFKQQEYFARAAGCARFVWNYALAEWDRQYQEGGKPSGMQLKKEFNAKKYEAFPWMKAIHRDAHATPFANLDKAFQSFFKGTSKRPKFKKKGKCRDSFAVANDKFKVEGKTVVLPKIGRVRLTESLRFSGNIVGAVVSRTAGHWFISVRVDVGDFKKPRGGDGIVGVDLGIKVAATLSTGEQLSGPKPLKAALKKLAHVNRELSRRVKGSANYRKTKLKLAKVYARISSIRKDWIDKLTTRLCHENQVVAIESLNVRGMLKNRRLARSVSDMGFREFARQMTYKCQIFGTEIVVADQWFPSSKTCSNCESVKAELSLREREFMCEACGVKIDRDLNAALNLRALGLRAHACGRLGNLNGSDSVEAESGEAGTKPCASTH